MVAAGARLVAVAGRRPEGRAAELAAALGGIATPLAELGGRGEAVVLMAVADAALEAVADALAAAPPPVALHTAGARSAEALAPLAAAGAAVGSLHPLKAFPRPLPEPQAAAGVVFVIDGAPAARRLAARLAAAVGGEAVEVPAAARRLYHYGATLASGGVVTLLAAAWGLAARLGLPEAVGRGYLELARGAVAVAAGAGHPAEAITGPVARGEVEAVRAAFSELARVDPALLALARPLAAESLRQLASGKPLGTAQAGLLAALERGDLG
jgi:predicted short-subunit dehydrogenase-like oxidoreductase (DUF2520 family)